MELANWNKRGPGVDLVTRNHAGIHYGLKLNAFPLALSKQCS